MENNQLTRAQHLFKTAKPEIQKMIKRFLKEEREVMHFTRRPEIHSKLCEIIRQEIR